MRSGRQGQRKAQQQREQLTAKRAPTPAAEVAGLRPLRPCVAAHSCLPVHCALIALENAVLCNAGHTEIELSAESFQSQLGDNGWGFAAFQL